MKKISATMACLLVINLVISTVFISGCAEEKEIAIGAIFPLTGPAARIGEMKKQGVDLAVEHINAQGGINGKKLTVLYEDSQNDAKTGLAAFNKLVQINKVSVIMSAMSGVSMPLVPKANENKVVLFANIGHPEATKQSEWVFRNFPLSSQEGCAMAEFAVDKLAISKVAILSLKNDWTLSLTEEFKKCFETKDGEVTTAESYEITDTDFKTQLTKIKKTKPEALYFTGFGRQLGLIVRQKHELGMKGYSLTMLSFNDPPILEIAGEASNDVYFTTSDFNPDKPKTELASKFVNDFVKKYGRKPGLDEAFQYETVLLITSALRKVGTNPTKIRDFLSNTRNFEGVTGNLSINETGDIIGQVVVMVTKNGKAENVK